MPNRRHDVTISGALGHDLAVRVDLPESEPAAWALFAHCFTCSKDHKAMAWISRGLVERGIAVVRFDLTGLGASGGDFADTSFTTNVEDVVAVADWMREHHRAPDILLGHSLGGTAMLVAGARIPDARVIATLAAASDTGHLRDLLAAKAPGIEERGAAEVELLGRTARIRRQLLDDLASWDVLEHVGALDAALLVFHSPEDPVVEPEHAERIFAAAPHPKSLVWLDGADHLLLADRDDARYVAHVLVAWASRYVEALAPAIAVADVATPPGEVVVRGGGHGFAQTVRARRHLFAADEPEKVGGTDTGPSPYDLLLAALGTCTSMTLRMYADHKEWPLDEVTVTLSHSRVHAEDCEECEEPTAKISRIERTVAVAGELDDDQRARLLEIADRCPVHRTLTGAIEIPTRLVD